MANELIEQVRNKEKEIYHTTDLGKYIIRGVGSFARITAVLSAVNFDNGSLARWKNKMATESFKKAVPMSGNVSAHDAHKAFLTALSAGDTFAKSAADFGTQVHSWLENYALTGQFPQQEPDVYSPFYNVFQGVKQFVKDTGLGTPAIEVVKPELFVYHSLGFAGTADLVVMRNGKVYLFDYKATNHLKASYLLQVAAYTAALKDLYNLTVEKASLIRFDKKQPIYERVSVGKDELAMYFEMFKMCLMFYRFIQNPTFAEVKDLYTPEHLKEVTAGLL